MDIQAVESKLSDVTVTPIPRSQVQNFYNYQQQREQREQQPQIQISAIHHTPRDRHHNERGDPMGHSSSSRDLYASKREREYQKQLSNVVAAVTNSGGNNAAVAAVALQYSQQFQAQLALLQQQANSTPSPSITLTPAAPRSSQINSNNNLNSNGSQQSQLKYPQSSSPLILSSHLASSSSTQMTNTANLPSSSSSGLNNGLTKYAQLLAVIEEMGRDIRPTYTGSRTSTERLKRGIVHARILVRECLMETERSARQ